MYVVLLPCYTYPAAQLAFALIYYYFYFFYSFFPPTKLKQKLKGDF